MYYDRAKLICPSMESIDGKTGESVPIFTFTICGDKATTSYDRSLFIKQRRVHLFPRNLYEGFDKDETL